ncbi:hypothetical protein Tco_1547734 [Tanacetum coccineum]
MLSKFVNSNTASSSGSGTLPSNTITNLKEDYKGPTIPTSSSSSPKVVKRKTEVTKDTVIPTNNGSTEDVQPPVVPVETQNFEPVVAHGDDKLPVIISKDLSDEEKAALIKVLKSQKRASLENSSDIKEQTLIFATTLSSVLLGRDNGENIMKSIKEGPFQMGTVSDVITGGTEGAVQQGPVRARVLNDLSAEEKERYKADIRATNILLQGIPKDIYSLINHYTDAKDIWENVKNDSSKVSS